MTDGVKEPTAWRLETLKAFANSSPGVCFETLGLETSIEPSQLLGIATLLNESVFPRVVKAQPWTAISERFQR